jgi:hypothetical protein
VKTATQTTFVERLGRALGRAWRGCVRLDQRANDWLLSQGWSTGLTRTTLLVTKLAVLGVLAYAAFWLAVLFVMLILVAWVMRCDISGTADDDNKPEWREGHGGFGLYDKNEWRHDMGDPDQT